jgi:hypothetical protein
VNHVSLSGLIASLRQGDQSLGLAAHGLSFSTRGLNALVLE